MAILFKNFVKKIVLIIVIISILLTFFAMPSSYAKLDIPNGQFYYSGTTKGTYTVTEGIFAWLLKSIGDIADWLIGIMTMGFRMVFVGWAALAERLLTWALKTTTGVGLKGELIDNSTDFLGLIQSSDNVTIEAIVYNRVPALNINFFEDQVDPTISGTGQKLVCEVCNKNVDECCGESGTCNNCKCRELNDGCEACEEYTANLKGENLSLIQLLRDQVSKWYYVMRFLALAAMLVVLIAVGIKMVITSIAKDRALFKRMLVDWVVGIIIIFGIHFIMYAVILINEGLVDVVRENAEKLNAERMSKLNLMTLAEKAEDFGDKSGEFAYTDQDLEIKVYEEIRTRAYDPKLTVGIPGMIMYITLVYFAVRFTIVYLKRYFTIMILALMGPGIGVSYAIQKVFRGRSQSYTNWLKEFVYNVILQTIHAILYSIFVAQALILSLDSLAGMIIALVLLNYMLKADQLFRKIFNINGNLIASTADAGNPDNIKQPFNAVRSFIRADATKEVLGALTHTPYATAVKAVGKTAVAAGATAVTGIGVGAKAAVDGAKNVAGRLPEPIKDAASFIPDKLGDLTDRLINYSEIRDLDTKPITRAPIWALKKMRGMRSEEDLKKVMDEANYAAHNATTAEEQKAAIARFKRAHARFEHYKTLRNSVIIKQPNALKIGVARFTRAIDVRNTFNLSVNNNAGQNARAIFDGIFGTKSIDPKTGKKVSNKDGIYSKLSFSSIANLSDSDKRVLSSFGKSAAASVAGLVGIAFGMGTIVAHPKIGLGLLSAGTYKFGQNFSLRAPTTKDFRGRYTFSKFSSGAINNIGQTVKAMSAVELANILNGNINQTQRRLKALEIRLSDLNGKSYTGKIDKKARAGGKKGDKKRKIKSPNRKKQTIAGALLEGEELDKALGIKGRKLDGILDSADPQVIGLKRMRRMPLSKLGAKYDKMMQKFEEAADKNYLPKESYSIENGRLVVSRNGQAQVIKDYLNKVKEFDETFKDIEDMQLIYQYNRLRKKAQKRQRREMQGEALREEYARIGFQYDPATGRLIRGKKADGSKGIKPPKISKHDLYVGGKKGIRNQEMVARINAELDRALAMVSNGKKIDLSDKESYNKLLEQFQQNLRDSGILGDKQSVNSLFKKGRLNANIQDKANYANGKLHTLDKFLERTLSEDEAKRVKKALFGVDGKSGVFGSDISKVTAEELFDAMQGRRPGRDGGKVARSTEDVKKIQIIDRYLKALNGKDGEFELIQAAVEKDNPYVAARKRASQGTLERILQEEYLRAGIIGRPETLRTAVTADFDTRNIRKARLSQADIKKINKEIQDAIIEVGQGKPINVEDKNEYREFTKNLTERLKKVGVLSTFQSSAKVIFKPGKLEEIVASQSRFAVAKQSRIQEIVSRGETGVGEFIVGIDRRDIAETKNGRRFTKKELLQIRTEMVAAITEVSGGEEIDLADKEVKRAVMRNLTEKLQDIGMITAVQNANDLFRKGRVDSALENVAKAVIANKVSLLVTMSRDDISEPSAETREPYTDAEVEKINVEINKTLNEITGGERISPEDRKTKVRVVERLTERLQEAGIITEDQNATDVFQEGRLEDAITLDSPGETEVVDFVVGIDKSDIDTEGAGRNYSPEELLRINVEIRAALTEVADGERIDISDRRTRKEVISELTERLQEAELIDEGQDATEIFQKGRLEEVLDGETARVNARETALERFLDTVLTDDETHVVSEALTQYTESDLAYRSSEDIAEEIFDKITELIPPTEVEIETRREMVREELIASHFDDTVEEVEVLPELPETVELTSADHAFVNREICDAIDDIANGEILEINGNTISKILKMVSDRAGKTGLLDDGKMIEDVFDRSSLEEIIRRRADVYNRAVENANARANESRTADRIDKVQGIATAVEMKKEDAALTRGARGIDTETPSDLAQPKTKTRTKMDQIIASGLDEWEKQQRGDILADILEATSGISETGGDITLSDGSKVSLSASEAGLTRQALETIVEMREVNRRAKKKNRREMARISDITAQLYRQRIAGMYGGPGMAGAPSEEEIERQIQEMMKQQKQSEEAEDRRTDIDGPVIDIRDVALSDVASAAIKNERIAKKNKAKLNKTKPKTKKKK